MDRVYFDKTFAAVSDKNGLDLGALEGAGAVGPVAETGVRPTVLARVAPSSRAVVERLLAEVTATGRPAHGEVQLADEQGRWVFWTIHPVGDPITRLVHVAADITAHPPEEEGLRHAKALTIDTEGLVQYGVWDWDISQPNTTWTPGLYRIYGLDPETHQPSYADYLTRVHPDDRQRVLEATNAALRQHLPYSHDERIIHNDGSVRYLHTLAVPVLDDAKRLVRLVGVCIDVTERKLAELALEEQAASVRFLANAGAALAESLDLPKTLTRLARLAVPTLGDWCVLDLVDDNGRIQRVGGAHVDPALEPLVLSLDCRPEGGSRHPTAVVLRTGAPLLTRNLTKERLLDLDLGPDAVDVAVALGVKSALSVPIVAHGTTIGVLTMGSSSSGDHYQPADVELALGLAGRAAVAIDNARMFGREQEAVQAREDFLSVAAHELNTPVTSLSLRVEGLLRGAIPLTPDNVKAALVVMDRQVKRLARQIGELLDVSRMRTQSIELQPSHLDLAAVVREVVERLSADATRAGSTVTLHLETPVKGLWDRARVDQVVTNLLVNAIKFGGGNPIDVSVVVVDGVARLQVQDRGIGIAADRLPHIFKRFERAVSTRNYGGLGLGLFIVRTIVDALGGSIDVTSALGEGSTFTVDLPIHATTEG
ncbi:MAG: ATP-binding protein [Deltaproteobacteria bacterium]|nr:ATP-binding protein [Deltaproteobacteria bacterium]